MAPVGESGDGGSVAEWAGAVYLKTPFTGEPNCVVKWEDAVEAANIQ